ncbi:MAG: ATP-dependent helicase C-terminal domain-containing protein, partial [Pseudomonadota bacterium]
EPRWVLTGGTGARMDPEDVLAGQRLLVVTETDGDRREARIRQAIPMSDAELRAVHGRRITWCDHCTWSRREGRVIARRQERLGAIVLDDRVWRETPTDVLAQAMLDGVRELGLTWSDAARRFRARVTRAGLLDLSDEALMETLEVWLLPHLGGITTTEAWRKFDLLPALEGLLDWSDRQRLDDIAPPAFTTPLGRKVAIDYACDPPGIELRLQELFGQKTHPMVAGQPLRLTLLSPAGRPVQITTDLPGFWASSYRDVRKDMRGRYPKHPWPKDPTEAPPTLRAKPRKG